MSEWKPPADAVPSKNSGWKPPPDAIPAEPSFQSSLRPAEYPLTSGAAGGGSMPSATGSAGSVAASSPSPEPQGPPSPQGYTFTEDYLAEVAPPPVASQPKEFTLVSGFKPVEQAVKETNLFNAIEGEKTRGRIAPLMFASPEGQQALKKISANAETSMASTFAGAQAAPEPNIFLRYQNVEFPRDPNPAIGQMPDPREDKILYDFETLAPKIGQRLTQFTEQERRERSEVGAWTPKDELAYRSGAYEFQSRLLHGDLLRISDAIKEGADPAAYAEKLKDIQAGLNYIGQKYKELAVLDRPSFREKVLELEQQLSNDSPDSKLRQAGRSFIYGGTKAMASTLAGAARMLDFGEGYTTADKLSDWASDMAQVRDVQQSEEFKESAIGKVLDGAGAMAIYIMGAAPGGIAAEVGVAQNLPKLAAAAGTIGTASAAGTMYAAEYEGFVRQAMEQGAPKEVAESGANIYAPLATAIEFFNPQLYLAGRKAAMEPVKKQFMSLIKEGMAPRTALKTAMELADAGTREAIEELGQTLTERGVNMASNAMAGTELNTDISSKEAAETALVSFILGGAASGVNLAATRKERRAQRTKANVEAMHWAMQNPKEAEDLIAKVDISEEEKVKAIEKVQRMASIFKGNNLKDKDPEVATDVVEAVAEKKDIEKDIKENPVDRAIEAAVGDPRKREVTEITKEIMALMEIPQDRTRAALAGTGMERVEEKVVKQPDGSVVLESKEPKTEEDEVDAILNEEFAAEPEADVSGGLTEVPTPAPEAATVVETPQGTGVEVEVGPTGAVTPEAISAITAPTAPEAVTPEPPVAQKPKRGKKAVVETVAPPPTIEPVTSITEVTKSKDGSQVEYKVPGWEDLRIVVQREKGGYAANIMVGDQALKIQPSGKEQGTSKLAILDAKERLDRAGREKVTALLQAAKPSEQRPANREEPKTPIGDTKTVVVDGKERTVFNSEGRPIHPTVEGVRNFWRWFGDSKAVDSEGRPLVVYHGTPSHIRGNVFDSSKSGQNTGVSDGKIYFTSSEKVAATYAEFGGNKYIKPTYPKAVMDGISSGLIGRTGSGRVYVRPQNGFTELAIKSAEEIVSDYNSKFDLDLSDYIAFKNQSPLGIIKAYVVASENDIQRDVVDVPEFYIQDSESANDYISDVISVSNPTQIKSAIGNAGYFADEDASIVAQRPQDGITPSEGATDRIENVVRALRSIVPDLAVIVHDTPEMFAAESRRAGGRGIASDAAFYDPKTNAIHLNKEMASDNTLFHEAAHPIILAMLRNRPDLFLSLYEQLAKDPAFDKYIKFGESYSDKDVLTQAAEAMAEFMADVAAGKVQFSKEPGSLWQKFVEWLQELMAKVGLDFRAIDLSNPQNVRDFAGKFARGVREGIKLTGFEKVRRSEALPLMQEDAQAVVDGWYSRLDQAVAAKGSTMPGSQWGKWLEARAKEGMMSMEEAKWTGLSDWLASKGNEKVTPQQVRDFLKDNRVRVEVKELGGSKPPLEWKRHDLGAAGFYAEANGFKITPGGMGKVDLQGPNSYIGRYDGEEEAREAAEEVHQGSKEYGVTPKFSQYQLPGASNYKEVLVTLPKRGASQGELDAMAQEQYGKPYSELNDAQQRNTLSYVQEARKDPEYRSSHFDEPNILVHLRLNDRTGPNGEKILFIEELQSDWGQKGKKKGFHPGPEVQKEFDALVVERDAIYSDARSRQKEDRLAGPMGTKSPTSIEYTDAERKRLIEITARFDELHDKYPNSLSGRIETPPSAPFVTSTDAWVELGLKQAIRMAAQGRYDRVAWSTGEQQFNRWGSQAFAWSKGKTGWRIVGKEQSGGEAFAGMEEALAQEAKESDTIITSKEELRDVVEGVMGRERSDYSPENWKTHINKMVDGMWERMQNEDSGTTMPRREGMKGFYDKIIPTVAKKVSKRLGGDGAVSDAVIGEDIQVGDRIGRQQSISITPEMRQRVSMGVPLMQRPKAIPVDRWNAMVPTIREALKSGATPEQIMEQIGDLAKGLDQSQKGAIQGKIQQVYDKIETMRKKDQIVDKRISEDDSKKLADAEKLRKSIKKGLKKSAQKRRDVYLNELAKDFTSLRIPKTALDDYISMATAIKDLIRGAGVSVTDASVDALRTDAGVTNEQIEQYIQQQQQAQQALDEQEMLEEFEQKRIEMGLEGASLTLDDIRSLMNSFAAEEQQQEALEAKMKAEQKLQMLRTMSRLKLEELSEHLKSQELDKDKKRVVANLKLIDIDRLSAKDAVFLIGMVNNIVKNDRWGGARTFSEEVGSSERAIALMQEFAAMRKKLPKPKAARNATEQVVMMMRRFFGEYSDKIAEALGMDGILNASAQANRMAEEIHKARDKYAKSVGYKDTELNRYRAQAYAYLQSVEGDTQEQQQASFEKLRNDLLESARMLMDPTRDTHRVKFPDLYIQAVAEVAEPARSLGDVKVAEPIRKMVEWEQQQHAKDYAMHAQAAELDHNKRMGYVRAYTARGYFETDRFTETQQNRDPSILERFFDGTTVKERLAGSKVDRVGRRPSQIVDLDFFSVQDSARRELYMDTFGARYIARMRGVLTDPRLFEGDNPVMTRATRDIMTQRVRSLIKADQVVADVFSDKWTKAYNKVSRRASAIALVGSGAFLKQLTPLVSTFFHVRPSELVQGMRDATQTHREGTWQNNIAKTQTIYERAQVMAGLDRIGETVARKAVLRGDENRAMELSKLLYTEAGHLSNELGRRTIALGDAWAATATWWAFYRQYIRKAGLENTNWKAELNEQAAAYASDREQFMQGANIPEANAPMYRNVKLFQRVVLDIFFSFNSFNLNNLNRMSHDIKDIRFGSPEARKRGYIDLAARLFEMAAFRATADALRIYATLFLADLILEAIGDKPEDDRARRAAADARKYDYWVRLLADVGMDFAFTGMGDIPTNVVKDGFNTIVNLAEKDTGPEKRNYDLYYVSDKDSYGVLGILYGQASNLFKAAEVMSMYKGVKGKEAKRMRDEAMILAALSVAHLAGYTDQTITRGLEREIVRRLPYQVMHKREERFGQVLGKALYDLIDQDEPYTPSDTYEDY